MQKSVESILRTCAVFVCVALLGISQAIADMDLSGQYDREATLFISVERCIYCDLAITCCQINLTRPTQPFYAYMQAAGVPIGILGGI